MDRQDIDALLIGALYGELTPADEARLAAHLESHPTDRGALDDLKTARAAVRESRIFDLQLDPPQAVSALLLQEAHRRAPKRAVASEAKESWFYRFTRVFLAHPAMAAAAMLVLVVGVAGTLYLKNGDMSAERKAEVEEVAPTVAATPPAQDPNAQQAGQGSAALPQDNEGLAAPTAADKGEAHNAELAPPAEERQLQLEKMKAQKQEAERRRDLESSKKTAIMVDTPHPEPKELDETRSKAPAKPAAKPSATKADTADPFAGDDRFATPPGNAAGAATTTTGLTGPTGATGSIGGAGGGASGRGVSSGAAAPSRNAPAAQPAPPPPAAAPAPRTATVAKPSVAKEAEKPADAKTESAKDTTLIAWAKSEHNRAKSLAANGDCRTAAKVAVAVQNRAPDYFTQYMATDRELKKCQAYIAAERDSEAEKSGKARAQKRVNADEPAATH